MVRQFLRANEVRTPDSVNDAQTDILSAQDSAVTMADFQNAVISQLRTLLGSRHWTDKVRAPTLEPATCLSTDVMGSLVYVTGGTDAQGYEVATADPGAYETTPAIGIIIGKTSDTTCLIQRAGIVSGLFANLVPGNPYYLGINGTLITPPLTQNWLLYVQPIGVASATDTILLRPGTTMFKRSLP